jgi:hypothetical protein
MSYLECPDCHSRISVFGDSHVEKAAAEHQIETVSKLPLNPLFAELCDKGMVEMFDGDYLKDIINRIEKMEE